jgi:type VI secretion system secreted protein VgrG
MAILELSFASGEDSLSARRFTVYESVSGLFSVVVWAMSPSPFLDLEALVGKPASLRIESGTKFALTGARSWSGVVSYIEQVQAEPTGLSTYRLRLAPDLWLLGHRRNHRIFQHLSIPDIADEIFGEWSIAPVWTIDRASYPKLELKIQYGESDLAFLCRLFEEAGIAFFFANDTAGGSALTLSDALHTTPPRAGDPLPYVDNPNQASEKEFVTHVRIAHEVRPGGYVYRDHDFRNPTFTLLGDAPHAPAPEDRYEQYHYRPGAFLVEGNPAGDTPVADDKGVARHNIKYGFDLAERSLQGARADKRHVRFGTNAIDLMPGAALFIGGHSSSDLPETAKLLLVRFSMEGSVDGEWTSIGEAVFTEQPYRPFRNHGKPEVTGVQSATVVGPSGQEIHTDEHGRVRVQFPWDREGKSDENSSCWMRVSQGWAGVGYGMITIPRIGQEVLVGFLAGDPDQPIVVGRVYNATQRVPYKLPENKTRSTWKSDSSLGSGGFNELMFEDLAGSELVWMQAQKNLRRLVKNDETITVGRNRMKLVKVDETETTLSHRTEVTGGNRIEITDVNRTTVVGGNESKLVKKTETERTEGDHLFFVGADQHLVVKGVKRERVHKDSHLHVHGELREQIDGGDSLSAGGLQVTAGGKYGLGAGEEIHIKAGTALIIEAASDLTIKGPGGFIRIDGGGVTIKGNLVKINSGGGPGSGADIGGGAPENPKEAVVTEPAKPPMDDVSKTGIAQ